jgi:hypothetical protein
MCEGAWPDRCAYDAGRLSRLTQPNRALGAWGPAQAPMRTLQGLRAGSRGALALAFGRGGARGPRSSAAARPSAYAHAPGIRCRQRAECVWSGR